MEREILSERKLKILRNTIEDYIETAEPITSGAVHDKYLADISTATLRNELNALEAMGYLKQLHTSGGRVPTTKAYRLFVDELMNEAEFDSKSLEIVKQMFAERTNSLEDIVTNIAKTISKATNYPAVVVLNGFDKLTVQSVKIIPVIGSRAVVLITTSTGIINNTIDVTENINEDVCRDASNFLTSHFKGRTIADMILNINTYKREMREDLSDYKNIFNILTNCLIDLSSRNNARLASEGSIKLLNNPEYADIDSAKKVLHVLEDENELKNIFKHKDNYSDISFSIGTENEHEDLSSCGVITANYTVNGNNVASIGIIGPQRMNYSKVAAVLKYLVSELTVIKQLPMNLNKKDDE
ncbi:MAG: heat-inducible transcriptional repressor HrcA [Spirochaetales bacterium]